MSKHFAELEDRVNRTCRSTAAMRAVELVRNPHHPIIRDQLAASLAGAEALERHSAHWDWAVSTHHQDSSKPQHSYFAGRARILDDRLTAALQQLHKQAEQDQPCSSNRSDTGQAKTGAGLEIHNHHQQQQPGQCTQETASSRLQVVSLGCGLDSRPWRLDFPAGARVSWFDVDQQPVLDLKAALLLEAGAELSRQPQADQQQAANGTDHHIEFPLKCCEYIMSALDLSSRDWIKQLQSAGFEAGISTVWVAEGLLYYLEPPVIMELLYDIATASGDSPTVLLASHIPLCNLEASRTAPDGSPLKGLFVSCVEGLDVQRLQQLGWSNIHVSQDLAVVLKDEYGAEAFYPYRLDYSQGKRLDAVEYVVRMTRQLG